MLAWLNYLCVVMSGRNVSVGVMKPSMPSEEVVMKLALTGTYFSVSKTKMGF